MSRHSQDPHEIRVDEESKLTLHGLLQYYVKLTEKDAAAHCPGKDFEASQKRTRVNCHANPGSARPEGEESKAKRPSGCFGVQSGDHPQSASCTNHSGGTNGGSTIHSVGSDRSMQKDELVVRFRQPQTFGIIWLRPCSMDSAETVPIRRWSSL